MNFFKKRRARKELKEMLHHAKHIRHMHEDIADADLLRQLHEEEAGAKMIRKGSDIEKMHQAGEALEALCLKIAPPRKNPKIRENVEVLFVAIAAAMAIRAYFFQPFKIPTGSMQPTLYGITLRHQEDGESSALPNRLAKLFLKGEIFLQAGGPIDRVAKLIVLGPGYTSVKAKTDGMIQMTQTTSGVRPVYRDNFDHKTVSISIGNTPHSIPYALVPYCRYGEHIRAGESIFRGVAKAGDYILVNRMKYNFNRPKRGDIVVFDAKDVARDAYYIKRMVGLPNETISIDPKYLLVNGEKPTDPRFNKLFNDSQYAGYKFGDAMHNPLIAGPNDSITLAHDEYLFFGDNTANSLDGRYFGAVKEQRILGSAFFVGLPLDRAGFAETVH